MVRDLQLKLRGGFDCGDPCAKDKTPPTPTEATRPTVGGIVDPEPSSKDHSHKHRYCLYIRYCEQPSDPVSPYAIDQPCGPQACEPTRIREGFSFELRCPDTDKADPEICRRFWNCIGDPTASERSFQDAQSLQKYLDPVLEAAEAIRRKATFEITEPEQYAKALFMDETDLVEIEKNFKAQVSEADDPAKVRAVFTTLLRMGTHVAQFEILDDPAQKKLPASVPKKVEEVKSGLGKAAAVIEKEADTQVHKAFPTTLEYAYAGSLLDVLKQLTPSSPPAGARMAAISGPSNPTEMRFLAEGVVFTRKFQPVLADSLEALREWSSAQLEKRPTGTHCNLLYKVNTATVPVRNLVGDDVIISDAYRMGTSGRTLTRAVQELLRSCFCDALNPPCPSCEDTSVLLACLTVENCRVEDICNLERTFVISPVNLRYWDSRNREIK
jgi:hypothetical protein